MTAAPSSNGGGFSSGWRAEGWTGDERVPSSGSLQSPEPTHFLKMNPHQGLDGGRPLGRVLVCHFQGLATLTQALLRDPPPPPRAQGSRASGSRRPAQGKAPTRLACGGRSPAGASRYPAPPAPPAPPAQGRRAGGPNLGGPWIPHRDLPSLLRAVFRVTSWPGAESAGAPGAGPARGPQCAAANRPSRPRGSRALGLSRLLGICLFCAVLSRERGATH